MRAPAYRAAVTNGIGSPVSCSCGSCIGKDSWCFLSGCLGPPEKGPGLEQKHSCAQKWVPMTPPGSIKMLESTEAGLQAPGRMKNVIFLVKFLFLGCFFSFHVFQHGK